MTKTWDDIDEETRAICTEFVFNALLNHAEEGGTYRYLIYDRLGFSTAYYGYLLSGMAISNEFTITKSSKEDEIMANTKKRFYNFVDNIPLYLSEEDKIKGNVNDDRFSAFDFYWKFCDLNSELMKQEEKRNRLKAEIKELETKLEK